MQVLFKTGFTVFLGFCKRIVNSHHFVSGTFDLFDRHYDGQKRVSNPFCRVKVSLTIKDNSLYFDS